MFFCRPRPPELTTNRDYPLTNTFDVLLVLLAKTRPAAAPPCQPGLQHLVLQKSTSQLKGLSTRLQRLRAKVQRQLRGQQRRIPPRRADASTY